MLDDGLDTIVAGIRCRDVLADLSGYLDGELQASRIAQLQAHLNGCDRCARFGGAVAEVLAQLRSAFTVPAALQDVTATRLHARVAEATGR